MLAEDGQDNPQQTNVLRDFGETARPMVHTQNDSAMTTAPVPTFPPTQ